MNIHRATRSYFEEIKHLFHAYRVFYDPEANEGESYSFLLQRLTDNNAVIFVFIDDSQTAIGFTQAYRQLSSVHAKEVIVLNDLYVLPDYRNQGVGSKLIDAVIDYASQEGISEISLETSPDNAAAKKLYASKNFIPTPLSFDSYKLHIPLRTTELVERITIPDTHPIVLDKSVAITGVTQGLGEAMLQQFVEEGWRVFGCGRNIDKISALQKQFPTCDFESVDVSDQFSVQEWAGHVLSIGGVPKIVINNAGIINNRKPFVEVTPNDISRLIDINLKGPMYVSRAFLPYMRRFPNVTTLINMSSGWGRKADEGISAYCASKFGIEGFTESIALENKGLVTIVSLDPRDGVSTPMLKKCVDSEYYNSRPTAQQWAKVAIPYIIGITPDNTSQKLTVPEI